MVVTVTKLHRDPDQGFWKARVTVDGTTVDVDRKWGSWMQIVRKAPRSRERVRKEVPREVAAALADKVRLLEKKGSQ